MGRSSKVNVNSASRSGLKVHGKCMDGKRDPMNLQAPGLSAVSELQCCHGLVALLIMALSSPFIYVYNPALQISKEHDDGYGCPSLDVFMAAV